MQRPNSINEEHWNAICYFWKEKGDLERYVYWTELAISLQTSLEGRMILCAWDEKKQAERALDLLLETA